MKLNKYISELLYRYECVIIPGFGAFITNYNSAKIHPIHHEFNPPSKVVAFNTSIIKNDGLLANYIAEEEKISFIKALNKIKTSVEEYNIMLATQRRLELINIGVLFYDMESNLCFEPDKTANYLINSYGLPNFVSPAILRPDLRQRIERKLKDRPVIRSERKSYKTLRRVTVLSLPIAALIVWGALNMNSIQRFYSNYSSFLPSFNSKENPAQIACNRSTLSLNTNSIRKIYIIENTTNEATDETGNVTETHVVPANENNSDAKYFIIGGCFKMLSNAENFVQTLKNKGFHAKMIGQNKDGLYRVSYSDFTSQAEAKKQLKKIQSSENPAAWLLENK